MNLDPVGTTWYPSYSRLFVKKKIMNLKENQSLFSEFDCLPEPKIDHYHKQSRNG